MPITLGNDAFQTTLWPEYGGLIGQTRWHGIDVLRSAPEPGAGLEAGCFPMVPFCNRLAEGQFQWQQQTFSLPRNLAPEPHAIHGFSWQQPWQVREQTPQMALLQHAYEGDLWPCSYLAQQQVTVSDNELHLVLRVANTSARPGPLGFGLHPYFPCDDTTRLHIALGPQWCLGEDQLLTGQQCAQHVLNDTRASGQRMAHLPLDHLFTRKASGFVLVQPALGLQIEAVFTGVVRFVQIYSPADSRRAFICIEPVSMLSGALCVHQQKAQDMNALDHLAPGQQLEMALTIRLSRLAA